MSLMGLIRHSQSKVMFFFAQSLQGIRYILFLYMYFCAGLFHDKLVHESYQRKEVCYGCILVESKRGLRLCGQEGFLVVRHRWRVDPFCKDFFIFGFLFWCCWWIIVGFSIVVSGYNFSYSILLLTLICSILYW